MLYGLEIINRPKSTKKVYFRFLENGIKSEKCFNEKMFIEKASVSVSKKNISIEAEKIKAAAINELKNFNGKELKLKEKILKTEEFKSSILQMAQNRLVAKKKILVGKSDFNKFIEKTMTFAEEAYNTIK